MALHVKVRRKNINLIVRCLDSWAQAGGGNADTDREYQMWSLLVGTPRTKACCPGRSIGKGRVMMMVWWRSTATVGEPMASITVNLSSGMPVNY